MNDKEKQIEEITQKAVRKNENKKCNFADLLNQEIEELKKANAIEEMAKIMCGNDCEECAKESANFYGQTLEEARNNKCLLKNCAKTLYEQGYRKIPDGAVVLTEGEYSDILSDEIQTIKRDVAEFWANANFDEVVKELHNLGYRKLDDHAIMSLRKAHGIENKIRKETAREVIKKFISQIEFHGIATMDGDLEYFKISGLGLREIAREQFGVEV